MDAVAGCVVNAMVGVFVCVTDGKRTSEGIVYYNNTIFNTYYLVKLVSFVLPHIMFLLY